MRWLDAVAPFELLKKKILGGMNCIQAQKELRCFAPSHSRCFWPLLKPLQHFTAYPNP